MIRILNFAFIAVAGLACLGLYRIAEQARIAEADLKATERAIARESDALGVLGAEWARLTQPARIQALAERHLVFADAPMPELASLQLLPSRNAPAPQPAFRNANAVIPDPAPGQAEFAADYTLAAYPGM